MAKELDEKFETCLKYLRSTPTFINNMNVEVMISDILSDAFSGENDLSNMDRDLAFILFGCPIEELPSDLVKMGEVCGRDWIDFAILHIRTNYSVAKMCRFLNDGGRFHDLLSLCISRHNCYKYITSSNFYSCDFNATLAEKGGERKRKVIKMRGSSNRDEGIILFGVYSITCGNIESALKTLLSSDFKFKLKPKKGTKSYDKFISKYSEIYKIMRILGAPTSIAINQLEKILSGVVSADNYIYFKDLLSDNYTFLGYKDIKDLSTGTPCDDTDLDCKFYRNVCQIKDKFILTYIKDVYEPFALGKTDLALTWSYWLSLRLASGVEYFFKDNMLVTSLILDDFVRDSKGLRVKDETGAYVRKDIKRNYIYLSPEEKSHVVAFNNRFDGNSAIFGLSERLRKLV